MQEKTKAHVMAAQRALASCFISIGMMLRISVCVATVSLCGAAASQPIAGSSSVGGSVPKLSVDASNPHSQQMQRLEVVGQQIFFKNPTGYCTLGDSERVRELITLTKCEELKELRGDQRESLDHSLLIQLSGKSLGRLTISRTDYISAMAKEALRGNMKYMRGQIKPESDNAGVPFSGFYVKELWGADEIAVYDVHQRAVRYRDEVRRVTTLCAHTLVKGFPMSICASQRAVPSKSHDHLYITLQEVVVSLITEN